MMSLSAAILVATCTATFGLHSSSSTTISYSYFALGSALRSRTARSAELRPPRPFTETPPVSGPINPTLTLSLASAVAAAKQIAIAAIAKTTDRVVFVICPPMVLDAFEASVFNFAHSCATKDIRQAVFASREAQLRRLEPVRTEKKGGRCGRPFLSLRCSVLAVVLRELLSDPVESRFLLARQRRVEVIERRLHGVGGIDHCLQSLLHRRETAGRCDRRFVGAGALQDRDCLVGCVLELIQLRFLCVGRVERILNLLDRKVGKALFRLLARIGRLRCHARLGVGRRVLRSDLVETLLLFIAE